MSMSTLADGRDSQHMYKVEYCEIITYQCCLGPPPSPQNIVMMQLDLGLDTEESKLDQGIHGHDAWVASVDA